MYVSAISSRFSRGMSTPLIRAMLRSFLTLPLLVARVVADHPDDTAAPDDLAFLADRLHARPNLHLTPVLLVPIGDPTPVEVVRSDLHLHLVARQDPDPVHPHLPGAVRQHLVPVLELDSEHGVGQWLHHRSFEHDGVFFGLGQVTLSWSFWSSARARTGGARPERGGIGRDVRAARPARGRPGPEQRSILSHPAAISTPSARSPCWRPRAAHRTAAGVHRRGG